MYYNRLTRFAFDASQLFEPFSMMSWLGAVSLLLKNPPKERKRRGECEAGGIPRRRPRYSRFRPCPFVFFQRIFEQERDWSHAVLCDVLLVPTASFSSSYSWSARLALGHKNTMCFMTCSRLGATDGPGGFPHKRTDMLVIPFYNFEKSVFETS